MNLPKIKHNHHRCHYHRLCHNSQITPTLPPHLLFHPSHKPKSSFWVSYTPLLYSLTKYAKATAIHAETPFCANKKIEEEQESEEFEEYLAEDGDVYQKTLRLVECAMFSAVSGLAFLLSNSLAIEKYFACFFALPIVLSSMRWGIAAGRKTMVATAVLLFVLSGPVKAITYLVLINTLDAIGLPAIGWGPIFPSLLHGLLGFAMGTSWRSQASWSTSVFLCSFVRAVGAVGYVLISSFLIGENILNLITINIHALLTYMLTSFGFNAIPSMNLIYCIFGFLLLLNCAFFVFLLHLLYAVFFTRLGMKDSLRLPKWLEAAI